MSMPERCPKCGSEMVKASYLAMNYPRDVAKEPGWGWVCSANPKDCRIAELERQLEEADKALIQALPWDPGARAHPYECAWVVSRQFESNCGPKPCNCWLSKADEAIARQEARKKESPNGPHN